MLALILTLALGQAPSGAEPFDHHCAACHTGTDPRVPTVAALRQRTPESIVDALTVGVMRQQGAELSDGARRVTLPGYGPLNPHTYPAAITSQFYDGRPPCNDCGPCSGFGCPNHAKGSPAVTTLRTELNDNGMAGASLVVRLAVGGVQHCPAHGVTCAGGMGSGGMAGGLTSGPIRCRNSATVLG